MQPWLSLLLLSLPLAAAITLLLPHRAGRLLALASNLFSLCLSIGLVIHYDSKLGGFQYQERYPWIPDLNAHYQLGVDSLSLLFLPFTCLLFLCVILASWNAIRSLPNFYFALLLFLQSSLLGVFVALDTLLFFLFWELTLIPFYFLISLWGSGVNRRYAAIKYTLFMLITGSGLLIGFVVLATDYPDQLCFDYQKLLSFAPQHTKQKAIFILMLIGVAAKTPLFPFHSWLPILAQEGPASILALIVGLKIGAYALLRFVMPLNPIAAQDLQWLLMSLGMMGLLYGAVAALNQTNLRRMLAFASLSHIGLVVVGLSTLRAEGLEGAVFQLLNFTLSASALFIMVEFIHQRTGSSELRSLGGLAKTMPVLSVLFFFIALANLGVPGTGGFPAELMLTVSALQVNTGAGLVALSVLVLGSAYTLTHFQKTFWGTVQHRYIEDALDLRVRELLILLLMSTLIVLLGVYPHLIQSIIADGVDHWVQHFQPPPL